MESTSSQNSLRQVATDVYVLAGVAILLALIARLLMRCTLRDGPRTLKIKLELVLCSRREKKVPITITRTEVYAAYTTAFFAGAVAITTIVIFFLLISPLAIDVGGGVSLFSEAGNGDGLSIAALVMWGLVLFTAIMSSTRAWAIVRELFLDPYLIQLLRRHNKGCADCLSSFASFFFKRGGWSRGWSSGRRPASDAGAVINFYKTHRYTTYFVQLCTELHS